MIIYLEINNLLLLYNNSITGKIEYYCDTVKHVSYLMYTSNDFTYSFKIHTVQQTYAMRQKLTLW